MRRAAVAVGIVCSGVLALAGCSPGTSGSLTSAVAGPTKAGSTRGADADAVEQVFRAYYQALLARDFATACSYNAPETNQKLLENLRSRSVAVSSCEEALQKIYATSGTGEAADKIVSTSRVEDIKVSADTATISWSTEQNGKRQPAVSMVRKIDGDWKLVDTD